MNARKFILSHIRQAKSHLKLMIIGRLAGDSIANGHRFWFNHHLREAEEQLRFLKRDNLAWVLRQFRRGRQ